MFLKRGGKWSCQHGMWNCWWVWWRERTGSCTFCQKWVVWPDFQLHLPCISCRSVRGVWHQWSFKLCSLYASRLSCCNQCSSSPSDTADEVAVIGAHVLLLCMPDFPQEVEVPLCFLCQCWGVGGAGEVFTDLNSQGFSAGHSLHRSTIDA